MKLLKKAKFQILVLLLFLGATGYSQSINFVTSEEYAAMKTNGMLTGNEVILSPGMVNPEDVKGTVYVSSFVHEKATGCGQYFDPPGPGLSATFPDDGWAAASPFSLPFNFCFFGDIKNQVWVNNNGNISFNSGIGSFTSNAFPSIGNEMIAAFWADFDFGAPGGTFHATITPTVAIFNWVNVGYFPSQGNLRNTCQIVITDGTDPLVINGNVAIHYDDMQWTTGSASGGVGGFGGEPATAGANRGNNIDFFQIGRFDHAGTDYDGPGGANDGVSWLDNKSFYFDFCSTGNIPPMPMETGYCDTFWVCNMGDTLDLTFPFIGPEAVQNTTVTFSSPTLSNIQVLNNTVGSTGILSLRIVGAQQLVGIHDLVVTGTDSYVPSGVTPVTYKIGVSDGSTAFPVIPEMVFVPGCAPVNFTLDVSPFDSYAWNYNGITTSNATITNGFNDTLKVVIENNGCKMQIDSLVEVLSPPLFNFTGSFQYCTGSSYTNLAIPDSLNLSSANWENTLSPGVSIGSNYSMNLSAGTYQVFITESTGACSNDTIFTISSVQSPSIFSDTIACDFICQISNTSAFTGGTWSCNSPNITILPNVNALNPQINTTTEGTYTISFTDNSCNETITSTITYAPYPIIFNDIELCGLDYQVAGTNVYNTGGVWSSNSSNVSFSASNTTLNPNITASAYGVYNITFTDNICSNSDVAIINFKQIPEIFNDTTVCGIVMNASNTLAYSTGSWTSTSSNISFSPNNADITPDIIATEPGVYTVSFYDSSCMQTLTSTITFPAYAWTEVLDTSVCSGSMVTINANVNSTIDNYLWNTGETTPSILVTEPGQYILTGSNECYSIIDTATVLYHLCEIDAPNIIVLSSQVGNNVFFVDYEGVKEFNCSILNRWGNVIYQYTDPAGGWDGKSSNGNVVEEGTYFYIIKATFENNEEITKHGFVQLKY